MESTHASSSKGVRPSIPITKGFQKSSFNSNGPKKSLGHKTPYFRANVSRGSKPRKHYHAHSHDFHDFKMKEHAHNVRCHYCGIMGHKNTKCYIERLIWVTQMMDLSMLTLKDPNTFGYLK